MQTQNYNARRPSNHDICRFTVMRRPVLGLFFLHPRAFFVMMTRS